MPKEKFSEEQARVFAEAADPHAWLQCADLFHSQAVALRNRPARGKLVQKAANGQTKTWDDDNKVVFLLCSVALENAIKAFLVYENPQWVSSGYLSKEITNHRLSALAAKSRNIPYRNRDEWFLKAIEEGNESWMRYPCGKRASELRVEPNMDERIWVTYCRVMKGYGKTLVRLLSNGWTNPHGEFGRWTFQGDCLGHFAGPIIGHG